MERESESEGGEESAISCNQLHTHSVYNNAHPLCNDVIQCIYNYVYIAVYYSIINRLIEGLGTHERQYIHSRQ